MRRDIRFLEGKLFEQLNDGREELMQYNDPGMLQGFIIPLWQRYAVVAIVCAKDPGNPDLETDDGVRALPELASINYQQDSVE